MKKKVLLILFTLVTVQMIAQVQSSEQKQRWKELLNLSKKAMHSASILQKDIESFPIYKIHGQYMVSIFGKIQPGAQWELLKNEGCLIGSRTGDIQTVKVPLDKINSIPFHNYFTYLEIPTKAAPHLDRAVKDTRADSVQQGIGLPEAFTGKDVYIGITDWGFDYTHPMFYDTLLQTSRVKAAWDQYKQVGAAPNNYPYGVEFDSFSELQTAGSDTANIYSFHTHGSHVAGITGGSGAGLPYRGFAYESEFLFCTFLIDAASVIDGFNWMQQKAQADGKRLVINMSWGLYYMGTLDGNSLLSEAIATLSDQGVIFVASAGNNGNVNFHIKKTFTGTPIQSRINFYDYNANPNMWGQSITMWGEQNNDFEVQLKVYNTMSQVVAQSDTISTATISAYIDSILVVGNDTLLFNVSGEHAHPQNNRPNLRLRVKNTNTSLTVVLWSVATTGTVHYWNVTELTTGVGNWGMPFTPYSTNGVSGDANYSIGEPTCAPDAISVAAYGSSYVNSGGNTVGGALATFTSIGPLYTEVPKPDIAAPGVSVASSISSFTDAAYTQVATMNFNGRDYDFAKFSGTSMASPCVAGIVALMLDANPTLSATQIKDIIKQTARLDQYTGTITTPGDVRWGMGKINAYAAVVLALNTLSIEEFAQNNWLIAYPNPSHQSFQLLLPEGQVSEQVVVTSMDGKIVFSASDTTIIDCSHWQVGTYTVSAKIGQRWVKCSLLKSE